MEKRPQSPQRLSVEYFAPKILTKGVLKQFAGSPLSKDKGLSLPGLPGR